MIEERPADFSIVLNRHLKKVPTYVVYAAWMEKDCLYVGMSRRGMHRPMVNSRLRPFFKEISHIEYWNCKDTAEATAREVFMRARLFPILDRSGYYFNKGQKKLAWSDTKFSKQMCLRRAQGTALLYDENNEPI